LDVYSRFDQHTVTSGSAHIALFEGGDEDGTPVVFLHAGVADSRMWGGQMHLLADEGFRALAYDRRGFGRTQAPDEPFHHCDDLEAVLDALGIHAAVLVGCSMGGALALEFALRHPGRMLGLVLVGAAIPGAPGDLAETERNVAFAEEDAEQRGDAEGLVRIRAHSWLDGPRTPGGRVTGPVRELFLEMNRAQLALPEITGAERHAPVWPRLHEIAAPTLLVAGDEDYLYQYDWHEHASETMQNAFAVVLEGTAHLPSLERPDLFDPLLLEFLEAALGEGDFEE
jgi:pimeloyl-ACP methyl ester carboxylesterase